VVVCVQQKLESLQRLGKDETVQKVAEKCGVGCVMLVIGRRKEVKLKSGVLLELE
jgi:hypothetical protein